MIVFRNEPEDEMDGFKKFVIKSDDKRGVKVTQMSRRFLRNLEILSYDRCGMWDSDLIVYARDEEHFNKIVRLAERNQ
jgi:hypothetical protein